MCSRRYLSYLLVNTFSLFSIYAKHRYGGWRRWRWQHMCTISSFQIGYETRSFAHYSIWTMYIQIYVDRRQRIYTAHRTKPHHNIHSNWSHRFSFNSTEKNIYFWLCLWFNRFCYNLFYFHSFIPFHLKKMMIKWISIIEFQLHIRMFALYAAPIKFNIIMFFFFFSTVDLKTLGTEIKWLYNGNNAAHSVNGA